MRSREHDHRRDGAPCIFVLEEDPSVAAALTEALRAEGYEVKSLANGRIAIADLEARLATRWHVPGLVVAGRTHAGCSCLEVLERLRQSGCDAPAIVLSELADAELAARVRELGIVATLQNPFDLDALREVVRAQLGRRDDAS